MNNNVNKILWRGGGGGKGVTLARGKLWVWGRRKFSHFTLFNTISSVRFKHCFTAFQNCVTEELNLVPKTFCLGTWLLVPRTISALKREAEMTLMTRLSLTLSIRDYSRKRQQQSGHQLL